MVLLAAAAIAGLVFALIVLRLIYVVVERALDNAIRWAIYNFGNDEAVRRQRELDEGPP